MGPYTGETKKKKKSGSGYLSGYANEGERWSKRRGEGVLIKWAHSIIINYYHSFGVKKWKGVGVPVQCPKKKKLDLSLFVAVARLFSL